MRGWGSAGRTKVGPIPTLSSKHPWRLMTLPALRPMPSWTGDPCEEEEEKEEEMLPSPGLAEDIHLSQGTAGSAGKSENEGFQAVWGEEQQLWAVRAQGAVTRHGRASGYKENWMWKLWPWGILFWRHFSAWFIQSHAQAITRKKGMKIILRKPSGSGRRSLDQQLHQKAWGYLYNTANSRTGFSFFPSNIFPQDGETLQAGEWFGLVPQYHIFSSLRVVKTFCSDIFSEKCQFSSSIWLSIFKLMQNY